MADLVRFILNTLLHLLIVVAFAVIALTLMGTPARADVRGNVGYHLDNMPEWNQAPFLSQLLKNSGIDCTVDEIFENGTIMGQEYLTLGCEGDVYEGPVQGPRKALLLRTDSVPAEVAACNDPNLPLELRCFTLLPYDERNSI